MTELARSDAPSRTVSFAICTTLVAVWGILRIAIAEPAQFPLTYAIPLLICIWTRDRIALWGMAAIFVGFHTYKIFWLTPVNLAAPQYLWGNYGATLANILVAAIAIHLTIVLRGRLEESLREVRAQAEELHAQGEELAQQNEELANQAEELSHQTEELTVQGEELASQNEELQSQSEEINALNETLRRREALLQTLLDAARLMRSEGSALREIAKTASALFTAEGTTVAVYERLADELHLRALAADRTAIEHGEDPVAVDGLVKIALQQERTAGLNQAALRPDLSLPAFAGCATFKAALCAPIMLERKTFGAVAICSVDPYDWTEQDFRLAEWLADQCGRVLQTLRTQAELQEADRRKDEFIATLSHELRNPLAPIRYALKLLQESGGHSQDAIRVMERQVRQLVRLIDDLLDATRLSSNKVQIRKRRIDLVAIVRDAIEACRPDIDASHHALTVTLPDDPVRLDADPERLTQVVTNLLNNANRYTPAGGRLSVTLTVAGGEAMLAVSDNGIGLACEDLERIFEMFTQLDSPGTGGLGIGLALVRGVAELHGGRAEARSGGRGRGSEFRVTLPVAIDAASADLDGNGASQSGDRRRVLVVDDNADSADMMAALLQMHGHEVLVTYDAEKALSLAPQFAPDIGLLDIGLPALDGYELARRLRRHERTRDMLLIALTGWGQEADRARAHAAGFDAHLTKPAEPGAVLAAMARK